jgi:replicative DNA helicase
MSADPQHRSLSLVTSTCSAAGPLSRRGESIVRRWDPEAQLVGALMYLSAVRAAPILELVPDSALRQPDNRWAIEIIRQLVAENTDPDPVAVLHTARSRGPTNSHPEARVSARRHHGFAVHLADLYSQTVVPALVRQYAREVLDDAFQRAVGEHGNRLSQLAERGADRAELTDYITGMRSALADMWRRAEAAQHRMAQR